MQEGPPSLLWAAPPGRVLLGCITTLSEQELGKETNKQHFFVVSASGSSQELPRLGFPDWRTKLSAK